jgi:hypothetical protein
MIGAGRRGEVTDFEIDYLEEITMPNSKYRVCKYCVAKYGIKGSELAKKHFETDEEFANHLEETHGIPVLRKGETEEDAIKRCAKKGICEDRDICQCQECKDWRRK